MHLGETGKLQGKKGRYKEGEWGIEDQGGIWGNGESRKILCPEAMILQALLTLNSHPLNLKRSCKSNHPPNAYPT